MTWRQGYDDGYAGFPPRAIWSLVYMEGYKRGAVYGLLNTKPKEAKR